MKVLQVYVVKSVFQGLLKWQLLLFYTKLKPWQKEVPSIILKYICLRLLPLQVFGEIWEHQGLQWPIYAVDTDTHLNKLRFSTEIKLHWHSLRYFYCRISHFHWRLRCKMTMKTKTSEEIFGSICHSEKAFNTIITPMCLWSWYFWKIFAI